MRVNNYLSKRCSDVQLKLNGRDFHHRPFENENKLFLVCTIILNKMKTTAGCVLVIQYQIATTKTLKGSLVSPTL